MDRETHSGNRAGPSAVGPGRQARGERRRRKIFRALHDCILEKGYSNTTLADVAERAGMSPSHLLYYFPGKESILEEYFAAVADWFIDRVARISEAPADTQCEQLADLWFLGDSSSEAEIGFMLECFGEAVHDGSMRDTKSKFDQECKRYLAGMLRDASAGAHFDVHEAAEIAYSLLIGLRNSVYFDSKLNAESARGIFLHTLETLRAAGASAPG